MRNEKSDNKSYLFNEITESDANLLIKIQVLVVSTISLVVFIYSAIELLIKY